jgi:hypothetical protein
LLRLVTRERDRLRAFAHQQLYLVLEAQPAFDDGAGTDDDARRAAAAVGPVQVRLLDQDAAFDARVAADVDVAVDCLQSAADVCGE